MTDLNETNLPPFMWFEALQLKTGSTTAAQQRNIMGLMDTEHFLTIACYHLWRQGVHPIDGERIDNLRGALSPEASRDRNRQFGANVLALALHRLKNGGVLEIGKDSLKPTLSAIQAIETAMDKMVLPRDPKAVMKTILQKGIIPKT